MHTANYHGMNAGVRQGLHYGHLVLGLLAVALMCLLAWIVSSAQTPQLNSVVGTPPAILRSH
jgi:hypothetical protein